MSAALKGLSDDKPDMSATSLVSRVAMFAL